MVIVLLAQRRHWNDYHLTHNHLAVQTMKKSEIRFSIALDDQKVPEAISWQATDAGPDIHFAKAINIALWDRDERGTMKIDLWTKEMPVDEMKRFYVDTIGAMAESITTATNDKVMAAKMQELCRTLMDHLEEEERKNK
jgi:gliding motility-associated protein GldC